MDKIFKGVFRYRSFLQENMLKDLDKLKDNPTAKAVLFTCVDSRLLPTGFTQSSVGDMFIVRSAGNIVPECCDRPEHGVHTEPAVLELACVTNDVPNIIVCGHSDCRLMNALSQLHMKGESAANNLESLGPFDKWGVEHSQKALDKFDKYMKRLNKGINEPIMFEGGSPDTAFEAYIDIEDRFSMSDKLSQISTLQQLQNVASYRMLAPKLDSGKLQLHAMWFEIFTGIAYYFSKEKKRFIEVRKQNYSHLKKLCAIAADTTVDDLD